MFLIEFIKIYFIVISTDTAHNNVAVVIHYFKNFIFHHPHNLNVIGTFNHADFFIV